MIIIGIVAWLWFRPSHFSPAEKSRQGGGGKVDAAANTTVQDSAGATVSSSAPGNSVPEVAKQEATPAAPADRLPDFDSRPSVAQPLAPNRRQALDALRKELPGVDAQFDPVTGSASHLMAAGRFLAEARAPTDDVHGPLKRFVDANPAVVGHDSSALRGSRVTREDVTAHNGMRTIVWQQQVDGVPLYNTILKANLTKDGALVTLGSHFMRDAAAATGLDAPARAALVAQPPVDERSAVSLAAANLGDVVAPEQTATASEGQGAERKQQFTAPGLSDVVAQLAWLPLSSDSARLTWDVTLMSLKQNEMFRVLVDAQTGEVLHRTSLTCDISDATYRVHTTESPSPFSPGHQKPSSLQPALVDRVLLTTPALNTTASPNGWINDGAMETNGNNVDAHTDTDANNIADLPRPNGGAARTFDFPLDLTQAPSTYKDASITQLFYWCNFMHDRMYEMGFTESAGNFQVDNFGRGGNGNDPVQADAQDGSGTNNANFSTPADGSPGRMQMFLWTSPTPDRDGSFEAEVVLHEYGHGVSNRLVGGGVGISALSSRGMGEGWSDFFGLALTAEASDNPHGNWARAGYSRYLASGWLSENYYYGARRYSYSTDMLKNPHTFKDIDPTQVDWHTSVPRNPTYAATQDATQVHYQGTVWAVMLWDMRANLIMKHGFAIGNDRAIRLVTDGLKLSPVNPNFVQARDGIIQATLVGFPGDMGEVWTAFAKRGMGQGATAPVSSTTTGVVESYTVPDDLQISDRSGWNVTGNKGGPFTPATKTLTLTNTSGASLNWSLATNAPWLDAIPSSGSLGAGAGVVVTISTQADAVDPGFHSTNIVFTNTGSGFNQPIGVRLYVTPPRVHYFDLSSDPGWTRTGEWAFGTPSGGGGAGGGGVGNPDPTGGATGANVLGVNLAGNHTTSITGPHHVTLGPVSLSIHTHTRLRFQRWLNTNALANSRTTVEVSADGVTWREVFVNPGTAITENAWTLMDYDISSIADQQPAVYVRWGYQTISAPGAYSGWNIDDVELLGEPTTGFTIASANAAAEGDGPVTATLQLSIPQPGTTVVTLLSSDPSVATVPASVSLAPNEVSATFSITPVEDALLDGSQSTVITAGAPDIAQGVKTFTVHDNETAVLSLSAPAATIEGAGTIQGTLTMSAASASAVAVTLSSSDATAVAVPASVIMPAGQTTTNVPITVVDDGRIDGTQNATITAHVTNWTDGSAPVAVQDNENLNLAISLPSSITEAGTGTGTVSISGTLTSALVVSLSSGTTARLSVPATATIAAGATSATFTLTAPNNALTDGGATVTISAGASGFTGTSGTTTVVDNDLHHYVFGAIASSQGRGVPFSVTITAQNIDNVNLTGYTGTAALSASGAGGVDSLAPATTTAFTAGVWTGNVTVNTFDTNVVLTASDGAGHTGASNAFNVAIGPLHHFAWNAQATRTRGAAVSATVTAQDAGNNTVTSFAGTAALSGYVNNPAGSSVVITEVNPNTPDEIEFMNVSAAPVSIGGWTIHIYDFDNGVSNPKSFAIPAGTTCSAGQIFRLQEAGTAPGTFPLLFSGSNLNWTSSSGIVVGVLLRDGSGNMVDFVCASGLAPSAVLSPSTIPASQWTGAQVAAPTTATFGYLRTGSADLNTSANWTTAAPSIGTANTGLTAPFPSALTPVTVSPTVSGSFTSGVWTGSVTVLQTASQMRFRADDGATHTGDSNAFDVTGNLTLSVPSSVPEGSAPVTGTVSVSFAPAGDLTVTLTSSDVTAATVPATVTIPAGQTSATFPITIIDDAAIDGTQVTMVTAQITSWTDATANISVLDNETLSLSLFLPGTVAEGSTATATVSASGAVSSALAVSLVSDTTSRLTVPATVTIASGTSSVTFNVTAPENAATDGSATVNVAASAAGYTDANASTTVRDNDVHHFAIATIASPQTRNVPFNVSITAFDVGNAILTGYAGTPGLTASGTAGAVSVSPATITGFAGGVWTGSVTCFNADTNIVLTASDGAGHTGASNAFEVVNPASAIKVVEPITPLVTVDGNNPRSTLTVGPDGGLYGTLQGGGSSGLGAVFKITTAGVMTPLANFYGANGATPQGGLCLGADGNFYGTTTAGGASNLGTIFRVTPAGVLTTLVNCTTATGSTPRAALVQGSDGNFYGSTTGGGTSSSGTIFKLTPAGVFTVLASFTGTTGAVLGSNCQAAMIQGSDGNLYGVTGGGGSSGFGTLFRITTGGTFNTLVSFTGATGAALGSIPLGALVQGADTALYGTTSASGGSSNGTIFKCTTAGALTTLQSFTGSSGAVLGGNCQAPMAFGSDGLLYGTTTAGTTYGTLFKITTTGTFTSLRTITVGPDAASTPFGGLVLAGDGNFYGTLSGNLFNTPAGNRGSVFRFTSFTSTYTTLARFPLMPPAYRHLLLHSDGNIYGTTMQGGSNRLGSVFKLTPAGTLTTLFSCTSSTGSSPASLIKGSDGDLYGTCQFLGSNSGTVFKVTTSGTETTLVTFTGTTGSFPGTGPTGGLTEGSDGLIYGTTSSGGTGGGAGTIFSVGTSGAFTPLGSLTGTGGANPGSSPFTRLVEGADGSFYGTTSVGGATSNGTVFKIAAPGVFTPLVSFTGTSGAAPGWNPNTNLLLASDGNFYGTTVIGGAGSLGTIYRIAPDGAFTSLLSFTGTGGVNPGSGPSTNLIQGSDGNFYGTTTGGGSGNFGTVFKVTPAGVFTSLVSFTGTGGLAPGSLPHGTLVQGADGFFYGTTTGGGTYGVGTVFRVSTGGLFQSLYAFGGDSDGGTPNSSASGLYSDKYRLISGSDGYLYGANYGSVFRVHQQPAVQAIAATGITPTGAMFSGSVIPNQDAATVYYQYGLNTTYGSQTTPQNLAAGTSAVPVEATLSGLLPGVVYHYRLVTVTPQGTFYTADQTFATPGAPLVITGSFTSAGQTGLALDGTVNPLGSNTSYYFEYGLSTGYGMQTAAQDAGSGIANVPVNMTVNSLLPGTTYHVRLVATNSFGTTLGDDQVITTFPASTSTIQPQSQYLSTGITPLAGLFKAGDGNFYGTMSTGGTFGSGGTVFRMTQGGTLTTLANFYNNTNSTLSGNNPQSSLVQGGDGNFYGTTNSGGAGGLGCIFKMTPAGQVTILVSFNGGSVPRGSNPICGLTLGADGDFYGVTQSGGTSGLGTVFKVTPAGVFTTLLSFTGTTGSFLGSNPRASLALGSDGNFYGTTATGGAGGFGTIFKLTPAGVLTTLVQFTGTTGSYPGSTPTGALMQGTDGNFYGTTSLGGANNLGTVFMVTPTAIFASLASFSGTTGSALGSSPKGALVQMPGNKFYGTTQTGGANNFGNVFVITPAGVMTTLVSFTGSTGSALGATPQGALVAGTDGALYGCTAAGGLNNVGSIFKVTTDGLFSTLVNLTAAPNIGRLTQGADGRLYGATLGGGGANGHGMLFTAPIGGAPAVLNTLVPVSGTTALNARAGMLLGPDGNYYGTTVAGGAINSGSVFKLTPAGLYTTLISFTGTSGSNPGSSPQAALILGGDGNYYGTTASGGSGAVGTIFRMSPAGVQTTLINFTGAAGANLGSSPQGPLTLGADGNYYGTTTGGGTGGGFGTVFKMTPAGVLTTLASFTGSTGAVLGSFPSGVLAQAADGSFYGTTQTGGTAGFGTVFKITPGGVFTNLASFTSPTGTLPGSAPTGGLFAGADDCLYGVTSGGGLYSQGTLFRVASDDSVVSLYSFSGRGEGLAPNNGLVFASDGYLYGGDGTAIYRLNPPPVVLAAPATSITVNNATLNGSVTGESYSGTMNFEYGITTAYGSTTPDEPFETGTAPTNLTAPIIGLQPFLTYHYRVVAVTTTAGNFYSQDRTFATPNTAIFNAVDEIPVTVGGFSAAGLPLNVTLGFAPAEGVVLTLVSNTGFSPVSGTFNGLPNGSVVSATFGAQTYLFVVNYSGGDGNDITLTAVSQAIDFPAIGSKQTTDGPFTLSATATSGLPVVYNVVAGGGTASVAGNIVTLTGTAGVVTIKATQPGDGSVGAAIPVYQTFAVSTDSPFVQIVSSKLNDFTLGIRANGTLWGWGANSNGQLGNASTATVRLPAQIGVVTTWQSVSTGGNHSVAVRTDGTLWAWGLNSSGQVGDGSTTTRTSPVQIAGTTWKVAVAGNTHTVAVKSDGTIWAWGSNSNGQLGQGATDATAHSSPVQIGALTTWAQTTASLAAGTDFTLALKTDGTLWAWGLNSSGQLGDASTTLRSAPVQIGAAVTTWNSVAAGAAFSIGTRSDGTIWTWGFNGSGQLADGTAITRTSPVPFTALTNVQTIRPGGSHVLAIRTDGTLWAWGSNNPTGQLGLNTSDAAPHASPVLVASATNWQLVAPGSIHSIATRTDGSVWSWGANNNGQLGYRQRLPLPYSRQFGPVAGAWGGSSHSVAIKTDGTMWVWGLNGSGQLGLGASDSFSHLTALQLGAGSVWQNASAGASYTLAVRSDGTLWGCGSNSNGQLGDGSTTQRNALVQIGVENHWRFVSAGSSNTLAIKTDGTLWAWGSNLSGALGDGTTTQRTNPVQIGTSTNWKSVASGGNNFSLASRTDGTLWAWGFNGSGQLGDGTTTNKSSPQRVGTANNWSMVAAGGFHAEAIKTDGTLWAWGNNLSGQLGDGTTSQRNSPVQIGADNRWSSVSASSSHTMATKTDGTLWAWGTNTFGQLGDAGFTSRNSPAQVGASQAWASAWPLSGSSHSVVSTLDGSLWGSGFSHFGQIGLASRNPFVPDVVLPALSAAQTISFPAPGPVTVGNTVTLATTTGSGLPASYIVTGPAALNGDQLTVTGPGLITVIAWQSGDSYWQSSDIALQYVNASPAGITGLSATGVTTTSAALNATLNPNGALTTAKFQHGTTTAYGTDTPITLTPNNGLADQNVSTVLTGLTPGATYHFRVTATNAGGITDSTDVAFTTVSNNANLGGLALSAGALSPDFASGTTSYTAIVSNPTGSIAVTPTAANANATLEVRVNGGSYAVVASGTSSSALALNVGANSVNVRVTAEDGVSVTTYTITVTRNTPYQDWAAGAGLTGPNSGPNDDFEGDGVSNLAEWAFGMNPQVADNLVLQWSGGVLTRHGTPTTDVQTTPVTVNYTAVFTRRKDYVSAGLTYTPQFSADLVSWVDSTATPAVVGSDATHDAVSVPYPFFLNGKKARFFRVSVTASP